MGKLADLLKQKLRACKQTLAEPMPDYFSDLRAGVESSRRKSEAQYLLAQYGLFLAGILKRLPLQQQVRVYTESVTKEKLQDCPFDLFREKLNNTDTNGAWLLEDGLLGKGWEALVDSAEQVAAQNGVDLEAEADALSRILLPSDPKAPKELREECPEQDQLDRLEQSIRKDDPQAERKRGILDRARRALTDPTNGYLQFLDSKVGNRDGENRLGLDELQENYSAESGIRFVRGLDGGSLQEKLPKRTMLNGQIIYEAALARGKNFRLSPEDAEKLRGQTVTISEPLKRRVLDIVRDMDAMEQQYRNSEATRALEQGKDAAQNTRIFFSEQGEKMYAFIPLIQAKQKVSEALDTASYEEIEKACEAYDQVKERTDRIFANAKEGWAPLYGANVNSTRPLRGKRNRVPTEYLEDHTAHSRANGMQLLYGFFKNTGVSVEQFLNDPVRTVEQAGNDHIQKHGLNAPGSLGAKLFRAVSEGGASQFEESWVQNGALLMRGMQALAGMAGSREEGDAIQGAELLGGVLANCAVDREQKLWSGLGTSQRRKALYRCALLLPEGEIDMRKLAEQVSNADGLRQTETKALVEKLRAEGKLDFTELSTRCAELLADAAEEAEQHNVFYRTAFKKEELEAEARTLYAHILETATPEEKERPGYQRLKNTLHRLEDKKLERILREDQENPQGQHGLEQSIQTLRTKYETLTGEKHGAFLSSRNSDLHRRMTKAMYRVNCKLRQLRGEPLDELSPEEKQKLKQLDLAAEVRKARYAAGEYYRERTENGTKTSFSHDVGELRANAAYDSIKALDKLNETLGLDSPASRQLDRDQLLLLKNRSNPAWMNENGKETIARMLYSMSVLHKHYPAEREAVLMSERVMPQKVDKVCFSKTFDRMLRKSGLDKLAEAAIEGKGKLTDAFLKAANAELPADQRVKPDRMTLEQKAEHWKNMKVNDLQQKQP